jgi:hypothetical protein
MDFSICSETADPGTAQVLDVDPDPELSEHYPFPDLVPGPDSGPDLWHKT